MRGPQGGLSRDCHELLWALEKPPWQHENDGLGDTGRRNQARDDGNPTQGHDRWRWKILQEASGGNGLLELRAQLDDLRERGQGEGKLERERKFLGMTLGCQP